MLIEKTVAVVSISCSAMDFFCFSIFQLSDKATDATPMASTLQARRFARP